MCVEPKCDLVGGGISATTVAEYNPEAVFQSALMWVCDLDAKAGYLL